MAIWRRGKPESLLHHSDQVSQYTSDHFQRLLTEHAITCGMSRAGEVWDNSAMESFFSTLKAERVNGRGIYKTRQKAKADVFDYIECFYNRKRRHSTIECIDIQTLNQSNMLKSVSALPDTAHRRFFNPYGV